MRVPYTYDLAPGAFVPTITIDPRFDLNNHDLFWDDARFRRDESKRRNEIIAGRFDAAYEMDGFFSRISAGGRWSELTYRDYDLRNGDFNLGPDFTLEEDRQFNNQCRQGLPADRLSVGGQGQQHQQLGDLRRRLPVRRLSGHRGSGSAR